MVNKNSKRLESARRTKYLRLLERFCNSVSTYLFKAEAPTKEGFDKKVTNALKHLEKVERESFYKGDLNDLQRLADLIVNLKESDKEIEDIKTEILYQSNQLDKSKNNKRYKKEKHTKNIKDWDNY